MSKSNMQHQREQDDAAEIEDLAAALKLNLKAALEIDSHFLVTGGREDQVIDIDNVVDVMIDLDSALFNLAVVTQNGAALRSLKARAIQEILDMGTHKLRRMAEWEFNKKDEAA